ncbi:hypothetical protein CCANI_11285 [Corynebacterium canis]|nr:hypothetical protein CCANI_11285 [Corynebacterium canis]
MLTVIDTLYETNRARPLATAFNGAIARRNNEGLTHPMPEVHCHLDKLLAERNLTLAALAEKVGVTVVNLSILKNNRAKAVRFSTLIALCEALDCQPGDLFTVR